MRPILFTAMLILPAIVFVPTAHACWGGTPTVDAGDVYFIQRAGSSGWIVEANQAALGIDICSWNGIHTETWQESNGIPGLQTGGDCAPDTLLAHTFVTTGRGQCRI